MLFRQSFFFASSRIIDGAVGFLLTLTLIRQIENETISTFNIISAVFGTVFLLLENGRSFELLSVSFTDGLRILFRSLRIYFVFLILGILLLLMTVGGFEALYFLVLFNGLVNRLILSLHREQSSAILCFIGISTLKGLLLLYAYIIPFSILYLFALFSLLDFLFQGILIYRRVFDSSLSAWVDDLSDLLKIFRPGLILLNQLSFQVFLTALTFFISFSFVGVVKEFRLALTMLSFYMLFHSSITLAYLMQDRIFKYLNLVVVSLAILSMPVSYLFIDFLLQGANVDNQKLYFFVLFVAIEFLYLFYVTFLSLRSIDYLPPFSWTNVLSALGIVIGFIVGIGFNLIFSLLVVFRFSLIIFYGTKGLSICLRYPTRSY